MIDDDPSVWALAFARPGFWAYDEEREGNG
jgi:hypothetical protein